MTQPAAPDPSVTADELLLMPRGRVRRELVRGVVREVTPAGYGHGKIAMRVGARLDGYVDENDLGVVCAAETGFKLEGDPDTVRAPDVAFIRRERVETVGEGEGFWPGAPDLAVEVVSPGDSTGEVEEKVLGWLSAGSRMVVVVNPRKRTVAVHRSGGEGVVLTEEDELDGGDVVPGWRVPIRELFA